MCPIGKEICCVCKEHQFTISKFIKSATTKKKKIPLPWPFKTQLYVCPNEFLYRCTLKTNANNTLWGWF